MRELPLLLPNQGWDPRILAFRSADVVTVFAILTPLDLAGGYPFPRRGY